MTASQIVLPSFRTDQLCWRLEQRFPQLHSKVVQLAKDLFVRFAFWICTTCVVAATLPSSISYTLFVFIPIAGASANIIKIHNFATTFLEYRLVSRSSSLRTWIEQLSSQTNRLQESLCIINQELIGLLREPHKKLQNSILGKVTHNIFFDQTAFVSSLEPLLLRVPIFSAKYAEKLFPSSTEALTVLLKKRSVPIEKLYQGFVETTFELWGSRQRQRAKAFLMQQGSEDIKERLRLFLSSIDEKIPLFAGELSHLIQELSEQYPSLAPMSGIAQDQYYRVVNTEQMLDAVLSAMHAPVL